MMTALALALLLGQSVPPHGCITSCGLTAPFENDCQALEDYEAAVIWRFAIRVSTWKPEAMCHALSGWTLLVALNTTPRKSFPIPYGTTRRQMLVFGVTYDDTHTIVVGNGHWIDSALAHEFAHVFRYQLDRWSTMDAEDPQASHWLWTPLGICDSINELSTLTEDCAAPAFMGSSHRVNSGGMWP